MQQTAPVATKLPSGRAMALTQCLYRLLCTLPQQASQHTINADNISPFLKLLYLSPYLNNILYQTDIRWQWGTRAGSIIIRWGLATWIETSDLDTLLGNTFYIIFYVEFLYLLILALNLFEIVLS